MSLVAPDGATFTTGSVGLRYGPAIASDTTNRIFIPVQIAGRPIAAMLDTGAPYCVCPPALAEAVQFDPATALYAVRILIRGVIVNGRLYRLPLTFVADPGAGRALEIEPPFFVSDSAGAGEWDRVPPFLGVTACLDAIRFAVDPSTDTFHFGRCS
jgi:hypothetical protein